MKYSIILPYYKKYPLICTVLESFKYLYKNRNDYEIIMIEDLKNIEDTQEHTQFINLKTQFASLPIVQVSAVKPELMATAKYNLGVKIATGKYIILTNPDTYHESNILNGLDLEYTTNEHIYIMCSCMGINSWAGNIPNIHYVEDHWLQHSVYNNRVLHFCSSLSKQLYEQIGGFDEEYCKGFWYDDDDFRNTINKNNIPIIFRDDLKTIHLPHNREYQNNIALREKNANYYHHKWN
jgi:hypothetical protein